MTSLLSMFSVAVAMLLVYNVQCKRLLQFLRESHRSRVAGNTAWWDYVELGAIPLIPV